MKYNDARQKMIENGENLSWCKPYQIEDSEKEVYFTLNEGEIQEIMIDGENIDATSETIKELAQKYNPDYDEYEGYSDFEILMDVNKNELGCKDCPWFKDCQAFDD